MIEDKQKRLRIYLFIFIGIALLAYVLFQSRNLIEGPKLTILSPKDGTTLSYPLVTVKGVAKNIAFIKLNDRQIFVNDQGEFSEQLIAPPGFSIIKVSAEDKFHKTDTRLIRVYLPDNTVSSTTEINLKATTTASSTITN